MTWKEKCMYFINEHPGAKDSDIAHYYNPERPDKLHQVINAACRELAKSGIIERKKIPDKDGHIRNYPMGKVPETAVNAEVESQASDGITMTYSDIVRIFEDNPRDVHTVPINGRAGLWFYAFVKSGVVYVTTAKEHKPSCSISMPRTLDPKQFDEMVKIYYRRCKGEQVSEEASKITVCQVYWYGILAELGFGK